MDLTSYIGPTVVAAAVAAIVTLVGNRLNYSMHKEKLAFERDQAARKADADFALAERKVALELSAADRRRRQELAEGGDLGFLSSPRHRSRNSGAFSHGDEGTTRTRLPGGESENEAGLLTATLSR